MSRAGDMIYRSRLLVSDGVVNHADGLDLVEEKGRFKVPKALAGPGIVEASKKK